MSIIETALHRSKATANAAAMPDPRTESRRASGRPESSGPSATAPRRIPTAPLVDLSSARLVQAGLMPDDPISIRRQIDEFRAIKRPLLSSIFGAAPASPDPRHAVVLVTSAMPDEGKSYTSLHLAMSLAQEQSCEVTLIDADAPRRTLSEMLGARQNEGLLEFLSDPKRAPDGLLSPTSIPSLSFMSAGVGSGSMATEMFAGPRMESLLDSLTIGTSRQLVVIDSAPVLVTSETPMLARSAGQLLLVVRSCSTTQDVVLEAVSRMRSDRPMGLILNRWSPLFFSERQYYGKYYGAKEGVESGRASGT